LASSNSKVVFDTNMLLAVVQFKIDVFELVREKFGNRVEFFVTESILKELEEISKKGKKKEKEIRLVKELAEKNKVKVVESSEQRADDALVKLAEQGFFVASNDKVLRKRIKMLSGKNIYLRSKKLIEIE